MCLFILKERISTNCLTTAMCRGRNFGKKFVLFT